MWYPVPTGPTSPNLHCVAPIKGWVIPITPVRLRVEDPTRPTTPLSGIIVITYTKFILCVNTQRFCSLVITCPCEMSRASSFREINYYLELTCMKWLLIGRKGYRVFI